MRGREVAGRVVVFLVVVVVVASLVGASVLTLAFVTADDRRGHSLQNPEYARERLGTEPLPAVGRIRAETDARGDAVVLFDDEHSNEYDRRELLPTLQALTWLGHEVRFFDGDNLSASLAEADAYVIIDPSSEYDQTELDAVEEFTATGGRLLLVGEPTQVSISGGFTGISTSRDPSTMTNLESRLGVAFENRYLYNLAENDGNYKHVVATAPSGAGVDGVERTAFYTATAVQARGGQPLLVTGPETRLSESEQRGRFAVAVRRGNVLAVGDTTFLQSGRHNVADNEAFIAYLIEFLVEGERTGDAASDGGGEPQEPPASTTDTPAETTTTAEATTTSTTTTAEATTTTTTATTTTTTTATTTTTTTATTTTTESGTETTAANETSSFGTLEPPGAR